MITIKNAAQIAKMREAGAMLHSVLTQLKGKIEPGMTTKELDRFAEKLIRSYGAVPSFLNYEGYPASICASVDSQVVHGIPSASTVLKEGQIISIDCGLILGGWQSDSAFTAGVGKISEEAQRLIDVTEESFFAALKNKLVYRLVLPTRNKARRAIAEYIEVFYNRHGCTRDWATKRLSRTPKSTSRTSQTPRKTTKCRCPKRPHQISHCTLSQRGTPSST